MKSVVRVDDSFSPPDPCRASRQHLHSFFETQCDATPESTAVVCGEEALTYLELDRRANRLAHALIELGAGSGTTVGILLDRSLLTYVALLGVLKTGAAFVPIDPSFPRDRIAFIAEDASLTCLITTSSLRAISSGLPCPLVELDQQESQIARMPENRPVLAALDDSLCYIIYTSGSTGRPKGVAVLHSNICHFLSVVTPIYDVRATDRVYHGMTIAFDFSIEEIWPAFIVGATLVAGPGDSRRLGPGLADFLEKHQVTVLCCVPTLLATLDRDVPSIRLLNLGGEACPRDLVRRWHRRGRRILNTYGPTETTVTATWTELHPDQPVTIGQALPGYQIYILDENLQPLPPGASGEICIGGKGVAQGYVNRPDLTRQRFVPDPFNPRPGARLYRTGDLGRCNPHGEIEYLGRIDSQVKIRGYRIELGEIEAVLLDDAAVENALVAVTEVDGAAELVAYLTLHNGGNTADGLRPRLHQSLHRRLPAYMVPSYIEVLDAIPMLPSGKADRSRLPQPATPRFNGVSEKAVAAPVTATEKKLAAVWQAIFQTTVTSIDADFFADLGGHSLLAARAVSRLRNDEELRHIGIGDLYLHPTLRALARFVDESRSATDASAQPSPACKPSRPFRIARSREVIFGGTVQLVLLYLLLMILTAPAAALLAMRHGRNTGHLLDLVALIVPAGLILTSLLLPIAAKWLLVGRFRPGCHRVWGWYYCRWWLLRKIFLISPMNFMAGSPLLAAYARLLGAKIGRGCHLGSGLLHLPDLIEIGDRASIGYEAELQPFFVENGWLILDRIRIGADAFIGTKTVILPGGTVGTSARIKDQSLVARNQTIPDGETWAGSPANPVVTADALLDALAARSAAPQRWSSAAIAGFLFGLLALELLPMLLFAPGFLLILAAEERSRWQGIASLPLAGLLFVLTSCALVALGKRMVLPHLRPGIYPLRSSFGIRKWFADHLMSISLAATNTLYATLFTPAWLRLLGAKVGPWSEVSTVSHIDPDLLELGTETFVADMASIGAATFHNGWIGVGATCVGNRSFVGNAALVRSQTSIPENCLLGVQSVPPDRPMAAGTSWLGSPALFLPRRQQSERFSEELTYQPTRGMVAGRLAIELLRVLLPATLLYLAGWLTILAATRLVRHTSLWRLVALMPAILLASAVVTVLLTIVMKWTIVGRYRPRVEPLWSVFVRRTELITGIYESASVPLLLGWLTGTPFLAVFLRALGARIGRRAYIDTTYLTEFDLVHLGDDCCIGGPTSLQTHLFEDRVMKMSHVRIGHRCTVGPRAVVLYDSSVGNDASLDGLSLVMKGESLPAGTAWRGIPARPVG